MPQVIFKDNYYIFPKFSDFPLICAFSNRNLDHKEFLKKLGINFKDLVFLEQVHGNGISIVKKKDRGKKIPKRDALITEERNLPIAIFTADCLPIFLFEPKRKLISLIHAGRKGTEKEITKKTILKMKKEFNTEPEDLWVGLGPAIRFCCYKMDLIKENSDQLFQLGVKRENIFDSEICTFCNNEFFSYRREGKNTGRMISLMMLK